MDVDLLRALKGGNGDRVMKLAREQPHLFLARSPQGNTTLHIAARSGNKSTSVFQEILKIQPSLSSLLYERNQRGETPLHIAAASGDAAVINLVDGGNKNDCETGRENIMRMQDNEGNTPLHLAVKDGHLKVVQELTAVDPEPILSVNGAGHSPLYIAIDKGLTAVACWIIRTNPDSVSFEGPNRLMLLHRAAIRRNFVVTNEILNAKKKLVSKVDEHQRNALHYAAVSGHVKIAERLLKEEASLAYKGDVDGQMPLHLATKNGRFHVVKMLVNDYPDVIELLDNQKRNILHIAAQHGHDDMVSFILKLPEKDDLMNAPDVDGNTPLHLAAMYFHNDVIKILSRYRKLNIRATNHEQQTALVIAQKSEKEATVNKKYIVLEALKAIYKNRGQDLEDIITNATLAEKTGVTVTDEGQIERAKKLGEVLITLTTLVAAFTFTAALTIPAEYRYNDPREKGFFKFNLKILDKEFGFDCFIAFIATSSASCLSAAIVICWLFWRASSNHEYFIKTLPIAVGLTLLGLASMAFAFVSGLFLVLSNNRTIPMRLVWSVCIATTVLYVSVPAYIWFLQSKLKTILIS